jgi:hypothetical protein
MYFCFSTTFNFPEFSWLTQISFHHKGLDCTIFCILKYVYKGVALMSKINIHNSSKLLAKVPLRRVPNKSHHPVFEKVCKRVFGSFDFQDCEMHHDFEVMKLPATVHFTGAGSCTLCRCRQLHTQIKIAGAGNEGTL